MSNYKSLYVARNLEGSAVRYLETLADRLGLETPDDPLHGSLIYSKGAVDWDAAPFQMSKAPLALTLENAKFERFGPCIVLTFDNIEFVERNKALQNAGATTDFTDLQPHVTIGYDPEGHLKELPAPGLAPDTLSFGPEFREEITWEPEPEVEEDAAEECPAP